jgi:hypothetical protein
VANVVRNPYSNVAGNTPSSLGNGQIGVNQADGRIFFRNSAGAVTTFSSIASYATTASFPASGSSSVLYLDSDTSRAYQFVGGVYVEVGVASGYTLPNATTSTSGGVVVGTGLSVDSGTVSANVVSVAGRTGTVTISSGDVSGLSTVATSGSYVDLNNKPTIIYEYDTPASFPGTGSNAALYIATDTSQTYRWTGSQYMETGPLGSTVSLTSASDLSNGTLADARLSSNVTVNSNLRWAMQASSNAIDWLPRGHGVIGAAGASSGLLNLAFFTAPTNSTVTTITFVSAGTATASLTLCKFALFTVSETITDGTTLTSPTITMVAQTASDTTIGNISNTIYSRTFSTAGGYPASYNLVAGTRYAVGFLLVGTTAGTWQAGTVSTGAFMRLPPMAAGNVTSLSDMPTSATTVSTGSYMMYGRIS